MSLFASDNVIETTDTLLIIGSTIYVFLKNGFNQIYRAKISTSTTIDSWNNSGYEGVAMYEADYLL
jgi:hypothetical protein